MKANWRAIFTEVHTWTGLVIGWLLFVIFFAGSLSVFSSELNRWMRPEIPQVQAVEEHHALKIGLDFLQQHQAHAHFWNVTAPTAREPLISVAWRSDNDRWKRATLHPQTGEEIVPRKTRGGDFFTSFHHKLHYISPRITTWLLFVLSAVGLAAMVAGVIIHKRIFIDFFTFRAKKGLKSWLDLHNLFSVLPLPFHFMIIYSGAMILGLHGVMDGGIKQHFPDRDDFYQPIFSFEDPLDPAQAGEKIAMPDVLALYEKVQRAGDQGRIPNLIVNNPNRAQATLVLADNHPHNLSSTVATRTYRVADGALLRETQGDNAFAKLLSGTFRMHLASFANTAMQWLYFVCGLAGSAMIASGAILWIAKRRERKNPPRRGIWWVERLNFAVFAGFPLSCISYFYANRLLPAQFEARAAWEIHTLFIVWLLFSLWTFCKRSLLCKNLQNALKAGALALFGLPLLDLIVARPIWTNLWQWDTLFLGVQASFIATGFVLWHCANHLQQKGA